MKSLFTLIILLLQIISCENKKTMEEKFEWEEKKTAPLGYPVEVYKEGLISTTSGYFRSLKSGITTGKHGWGYGGGGMGSHISPIPDRLHAVWLSYAEDCFYEIDVTIDKQKILSLFREGYQWLSANKDILHRNYYKIVVGFAPGGVVVVWVAGITKQVEIGRYEGKKIVIPHEEVEQLDDSERVIFKKSWRESIMSSPGTVPIEVQKANKNKPIPYGLWDIYRRKYNWKLVFKFRGETKLHPKETVSVDLLNGEESELFYDEFPMSKTFYSAIPKEIVFVWQTSEDESYSGGCVFDEKAILSAFEEVFDKNTENISADLVISVNQINTYFIVKLVGTNGKEVIIPTPTLKVGVY